MATYWVYILTCADESFYTGVTSNLALRLAQHESGKSSGYTLSRLPVSLSFSESFANVDDAIRAEKMIKGWSRQKKLALIEGRLDDLPELSRSKKKSG